MTSLAALAAGRRAAERQMTDTCTVQRVTGVTPDPLTGVDVPTYTLLYTGKAKRQTYEAQEGNPQAGGATYTVQRYAAHLPVGSYVPEVNDVITWTACPMDAARVGVQDRVVALLHKTAATAYRLGVEEVS
jgi:hypothetical protein